MAQIVTTLVVALVYGVPAVLVGLPVALRPGPATALVTLGLGPLAYAVLFVAVAGLISLPFQRAIVPGRFPRSWSHPVYRGRRLYGLCWTSVYYCKPVYFLVLSFPALKWLTFRLFGYRGSMGFTVYPDTWIRDLPLLDLGEGAYVSNRATLGTNMVLSNGMILVDRIRLGRRALVGHLAMLGPGVVMGDESEVGVGAGIGVRVELGPRSLVNTTCTVNHHARVGAGAVVGNQSYLGTRVRVDDGVELPPGSVVPSRAHLRRREDAQRYFSVDHSERAAPARPRPHRLVATTQEP